MRSQGFFNQYPYHLDIAVSPQMEAEIGAKHIQSVVYDATLEGETVVAKTAYNGKVYKVKSEVFMSQAYWLLVQSTN